MSPIASTTWPVCSIVRESSRPQSLCFGEALAMSQKQLGAEHPDVAIMLNHLAVLLERQGKVRGRRDTASAVTGDETETARGRAPGCRPQPQ